MLTIQRNIAILSEGSSSNSLGDDMCAVGRCFAKTGLALRTTLISVSHLPIRMHKVTSRITSLGRLEKKYSLTESKKIHNGFI